jgi:P-type Ca2+ transporter type 2C
MINSDITQAQRSSLPYPGLTTSEAAASRLQYGANIMTPPEREPWWKLFLEKFEDPVCGF